MRPSRHYLHRLAGSSTAVAGGVWVVIWTYWASLSPPQPGEVKPGGELFDILNVISIVLLLIGLTGAHLLQADRTRLPGRSSVVLLWAGVGLMATWVVGVLDSYVAFTVGVLILLVGLSIFSFATLRARVLPTSAVVPVIVGLLFFPFMNPDDWRALIALPMGASWLWLGYVLWRLDDTESSLVGPDIPFVS